jgi:hypothetical protein
MECAVGGSLSFDAGEFDNLAPFLRFFGDEVAEVGGRARKPGSAQVGKPRLHFRIGEGGIGLPVQLVDDLSGRIPGRADADPCARLVARQEFSHSRNIWHDLQPRRSGCRQRAQVISPDTDPRSV